MCGAQSVSDLFPEHATAVALWPHQDPTRCTVRISAIIHIQLFVGNVPPQVTSRCGSGGSGLCSAATDHFEYIAGAGVDTQSVVLCAPPELASQGIGRRDCVGPVFQHADQVVSHDLTVIGVISAHELQTGHSSVVNGTI